MEDGDAIISDELNNASIIDGIRLSKASQHINTDMNDLEAKLKKEAPLLPPETIDYRRVFMDGVIAPLPDINWRRITAQLWPRGRLASSGDAERRKRLGRDGVDHWS